MNNKSNNKQTIVMNSIGRNEQSLSTQVAEQIRQYIIDQQLSIGDKIPNEFELAEQLKVGRGTIREAIKQLVSRNILEIQRGRGTFIAKNTGIVKDPFGFAYMEDEQRLAQELFQIRLQLEPWIAELAAEQASEEALEEVEKWRLETENMLLADKNYLPADQNFHISIAACTNNRVLPMLIPVITYSIHLFGKMLETKALQETINTHNQIMSALRCHDPAAASQAMRAHLLINKNTISFLG